MLDESVMPVTTRRTWVLDWLPKLSQHSEKLRQTSLSYLRTGVYVRVTPKDDDHAFDGLCGVVGIQIPTSSVQCL